MSLEEGWINEFQQVRNGPHINPALRFDGKMRADKEYYFPNNPVYIYISADVFLFYYCRLG